MYSRDYEQINAEFIFDLFADFHCPDYCYKLFKPHDRLTCFLSEKVLAIQRFFGKFGILYFLRFTNKISLEERREIIENLKKLTH